MHIVLGCLLLEDGEYFYLFIHVHMTVSHFEMYVVGFCKQRARLIVALQLTDANRPERGHLMTCTSITFSL